MSDKKFVVVSMANENFRQLQDLTSKTLRSYSEKHGYSFLTKIISNDSERPPSWHKIEFIQEVFTGGYEYVWWVDCDAIIVNSEIRIEDFIKEGKDFYISRDMNGINCGVFMIRNNERSVSFFEKVWSMVEYKDHIWWEQAAIMELLSSGWYSEEFVEYLPSSVFNNYEYTKSCLVHHMAGKPLEERYAFFSSVIEF